MLDDLVVWLKFQLAREEAMARDAGDGDAGRWNFETDSGGGCAQIRNGVGDVVVYGEGNATDEEAAHIAYHDPLFVSSDISAKRRIIIRCLEVIETASDHHTVESCDEDDAVLAEAVLRALASAYADRPGYREKWRPWC